MAKYGVLIMALLKVAKNYNLAFRRLIAGAEIADTDLADCNCVDELIALGILVREAAEPPIEASAEKSAAKPRKP